MLEVLSKENASIALGYASIVAWLFAQSPQVLENYKNGSVEGELKDNAEEPTRSRVERVSAAEASGPLRPGC